jgi:hypothetical protein
MYYFLTNVLTTPIIIRILIIIGVVNTSIYLLTNVFLFDYNRGVASH